MKIIFIASVILLFIVFIFFSYRQLHLLFVRLSRGKYHRKYLGLHKRYFKTNPWPYCIKEDIYTRIMPFAEANETIPHIRAGQSQLIEKYSFFSSFKEIRQKEGTPNCYQAYFDFGTDLKIMGYHMDISGYKGRKIYYFIDDLLFMTEWVSSQAGEDLKPGVLNFLFGIEPEQDGKKLSKSFYLDIPGEEDVYFRDAAFSIVVSHFSSAHPHIQKSLRRIRKGLEDRRESFGQRQKKS